MPALLHVETLSPSGAAIAHALWAVLARLQKHSPVRNAQVAEVLSVLSAEFLGRACADARQRPPLCVDELLFLSDWCLETQRRALAVARVLLGEDEERS